VPFSGSQAGQRGIKSMFNFVKCPRKKKEVAIEFEEQRNQLEQRMGVIVQGLGRVGVRAVQLDTPEIMELFYKAFNPGDISTAIKNQQ
jgi:hypothetical protein